MTSSRIFAIVVIGSLLLLASLTIYGATKPVAGGVSGADALYEQRKGEWTTGNIKLAPVAGAAVGANPYYDHNRGDWVISDNTSTLDAKPDDMSALDPKLDKRDHLPAPTQTPFEHGEWMIER